MIIYDLQCSTGHEFEGWFSGPEDYQQQQQQHLLVCPLCGDEEVKKLPTASKISTSANRSAEPPVATHEDSVSPEMARELLGKLRDYIDQNYDDVGARFPEEARQIHYGETGERNIRGTATADEVAELQEEGVSAIPLPTMPVRKNKLN